MPQNFLCPQSPYFYFLLPLLQKFHSLPLFLFFSLSLTHAHIPYSPRGGQQPCPHRAQQQQQTRQKLEDARNNAVQLVTTAWATYGAAKASIDSTRQQVKANEIALEGVQREALVGSRTTLDVLNAEQTLLNSRVQLIQNISALVNAAYQVAAAAGRLTARDLNLQVPLYDETAYYNAVRSRWIGTGDYATDQPAR